jgi:hypothetical protein
MGGGGVEKRGSLACGQSPFLDSPSQDFLNLSLLPFLLLSFGSKMGFYSRGYTVYCTVHTEQISWVRVR